MNAASSILPIGQIFVALGLVGFTLAIVIAGGLSATFLAESTPPARLRFVPNGVPICSNSPSVCAAESTYRLDPTEPCWNCYDTLPVVLCSGDTTCAYGEVPAFFSPNCATCVSVNGTTIVPTTLASGGGTLSLVINGTDPLAIRGLSANSSRIVLTQGPNIGYLDLDASIRGTCSASMPACASTERVFYNGTCFSCLALPTGGSLLCGACSAAQVLTLGANGTCFDCITPATVRDLCGACSPGQTVTLGVNGTCYDCITPPVVRDLCGACSVGQTLTLGVNSTCYDCITPTTPVQQPPSSVGGLTSLISNATANEFKSIEVVGGVASLSGTDTTLTIVADNIVGGPSNTTYFGIQRPSLYIEDDGPNTYLYRRGYEFVTTSPGALSGGFNLFLVTSTQLRVDVHPPAANFDQNLNVDSPSGVYGMGTVHMFVNFAVNVASVGDYSGYLTTPQVPSGLTATTWGGGTIACVTTNGGAPRGGLAYGESGGINAIYFQFGATATATTFQCRATIELAWSRPV